MARRLSLFLGGVLAPLLVAARLEAAPPDPTAVVFSSVTATTLAVDWQGLAGTTVQYTVELASSAFVEPHSSSTLVLSSTFTALDVNAVYFTRVIAYDTVEDSSSSWTASVSTCTLANPPLALTTTSVSFIAVGLSWDGNGNPDGTVFVVERSSDGLSFSAIASETATTSTDASVTPGATYEYRVLALNDLNVPSATSNSITVTIPGTASLPRMPTGFSLTRTQTGPSAYQIDFQWHAVTERTDGSAMTNLFGYQIYTSTSLLQARSQWVVVSTPAAASWTTTTDGTVTYYALKTIDTDGQTSDWSRVLDDSSDLNHYFVASDFVSRIQLPQNSANVFLRGQTTYGSDLELTLTEVSSEETGRVARSMSVKLFNYDTGEEIAAPTFALPVLRGTLAYSVSGGVVVPGAPAASRPFRIPLIDSAQAAEELSLFWFNGNEWVKTSAVINTTDNTVSFTAPRIGRFQIRAASHASGLVLTRVYPRIFSPNGDGWNDKVIFEFDNPQLLPLSGKMYDLSDAFVAELAPGPASDSTLAWDGKDDGGKAVPGGIYLYQIEQGGTSASGTVVVAR